MIYYYYQYEYPSRGVLSLPDQFASRSSSLTVINVLPCLFSPGHSCLRSTLDERVAPQPHSLSGIASTSTHVPVLSNRSWFCSNLAFRHMYITTNLLVPQYTEVPRLSPICFISTGSRERRNLVAARGLLMDLAFRYWKACSWHVKSCFLV